MDVADYIKSECDRQHVTNYQDFEKAVEYAGNVSRVFFNGNFGLFVQRIAYHVEPQINAMVGNASNLRRSEVGFMHGGNAARAAEVPRLFERWVSQVSEEMLGNEDFFIKSLLDIHPWADGNGRTASILRNWMFGNLKDPEQLPYYYSLDDPNMTTEELAETIIEMVGNIDNEEYPG